MEKTVMQAIDSRAFRGVEWVGKAALFCLGLLTILALVVVMTCLTAVMLMATALPATAGWKKHGLRSRRDSTNTSEFSELRKAVAPEGQREL